jgi:hypothetical protein
MDSVDLGGGGRGYVRAQVLCSESVGKWDGWMAAGLAEKARPWVMVRLGGCVKKRGGWDSEGCGTGAAEGLQHNRIDV